MTGERPNIVLLHWHDVGKHLGVYGMHPETTPALNAVAHDGTRFDRAFSTAPLCSPARGSLFTGRYPHSNGLMGLAHLGWRYDDGERPLADLLREVDYRTALIGLQHEDPDPSRLGYDEVLQTDGRQYCDAVADLVERFFGGRRVNRRPWFVSVGFWETHRPYPRERYDYGEPEAMVVPPFLPDTPETREDLAGLYGAIRSADRALGRIVNALVEAGLWEDAWFVFTTDHGMAFPRAKSTLYDPGIEVALIMRTPASWNSPSVVGDLVSHVDVAPTILQSVGLEPPSTMQGNSFLARLLRDEPFLRDAVFAEKNWHDADQFDPVRAIRTQHFKYIRSFAERPHLLLPGDIEASPTRRGLSDAHLQPRPSEELYDLRVDPFEQNNVFDHPSYRETQEELADRLQAWQRGTDDPLLKGDIPAPEVPAAGASDPHAM